MLRPKLVNPIHHDPALLIDLPQSSEKWLLDCGDLHPLDLGTLQSISTVFLSHGHIDHWIGFDALLRAQLFAQQTLRVLGPQGTLEILHSRLRGYTWNLIADSPFVVEGYEWTRGCWKGQRYPCSQAFQPAPLENGLPAISGWKLNWVELDHGVPCLGYRLQPPVRIRFLKERSPHPVGPWVEHLKRSYLARQPEQVLKIEGNALVASSLWDCLEEVPQEGLAYITDTRLDPGLREHIVKAFGPTEVLWCESAFLEEQSHLARQKMHATAREAASLARALDSQRLHLFHLSRRSQGIPTPYLTEARAVFPEVWAGNEERP